MQVFKKRLKHSCFSVCEICEIFKSTFLYRKSLVAAAVRIQKNYLIINSFDPRVAFHTETSHLFWIHIETSHLMWRAKQMAFLLKLLIRQMISLLKPFEIFYFRLRINLRGSFLWILITMKSTLLNSLILILWILCGKKILRSVFKTQSYNYNGAFLRK